MRKLLKLAQLVLLLPILLFVTPTYGVMLFRGVRSGKTYSQDVYIADVADALIHWDDGAGASATSRQEWTPPEPVVLTDFAVVTGPTVIFKLQMLRGNQPTGDFLRLSLHLNTLANRPALMIGFAQTIRAMEKV